MRKAGLLALVLGGSLAISAGALPLPETIVMAAPGNGQNFEWPVITADGTGLYSKIYRTVFGAAGIRVVQDGVPNARAKDMVRTGKADFYPGEVKGDSFGGYTFLTPHFAIWYTKGEALLFKKKTIPHWGGLASLKGKLLISQRGTSHLGALKKYHDILAEELRGAQEHPTGEGALKMLMADRADVLVTSVELIKAAQTLLQVDLPEDEYQIEYLDRNKFYPLFQDNDRGRTLAAIFDKGMADLGRRGLLTAWYQGAESVASVDNIDPELRDLR